MKYAICIEGENGSININDETIIKKIDFSIFQNDKSATERSETLYNTLTVKGVLNEKSQNETKEILDWSMKTTRSEAYKTVSIQVYSGGDLIRDYYLKNMYCTNYTEIFDEYQTDDESEGEDSVGTFILEMKQRKGSIDTIVVEC